MAYRFKPSEVEDMKRSIISHCESENKHNGDYRAWRKRLCMEGELMCCRPSKRRAAQLERELWLYYSLTDDDRPNWIGCDYWHTTSNPGQLAALPECIEIAI